MSCDFEICPEIILLGKGITGGCRKSEGEADKDDTTRNRLASISVDLALICSLSQVVAEFRNDEGAIQHRIGSRQRYQAVNDGKVRDTILIGKHIAQITDLR